MEQALAKELEKTGVFEACRPCGESKVSIGMEARALTGLDGERMVSVTVEVLPLVILVSCL